MIWELLCYAFCFAAEGVTAWTYFEQIYERTTKLRYAIGLFLLGYTLLFGISQIGNIIVNGIAFVLINGCLLVLNYNCKKRAVFLQIAYLTFVMGATEILMALLLSIFFHDFDAFLYDLSVMVAFTVLGRLMYFFIMLISARYIKPMKSSDNSSMIILLTVLPVTSVLIVITILYVGITTKIQPLTGTLMTLSVLALLAINIIVLIIYNHMQKLNNERLEFELMIQKSQISAKSYQLLEEQYEGQRVLIHDIRRHLHILHDLSVENKLHEVKQYIEEIENDPILKRSVRICDHPVLNIVLLRYSEFCKSHNINFHFDIRANAVDFMSAHDITAIFDNLLENAVEAAKESVNKFIDLSVSPQGENGLLITLVNSCDHAPITNTAKQIQSRKDDKTLHGVGLKSIARAAASYNGISEMYYDPIEKTYHYILQLQKQ